ncbi:hypothetical protein [Dyadobacter frigoris]|uniref:TMF family protein n=1 Tax=Dyadobacter frigoris TaxID=2576211 RepID=A0A4U6DB52_9BACT|nr:hypothetical protein [Dyadobacter frigoris]TKT93438.1 hypothetical protein FDK13_06195 [Dyadobacter frigoris]GLU55839.1 hypothetical protein Dfri01_53000 [Dyadobacter frigoris]
MKHGYLQLKRNAFLFLAASALLGEVSAQSDSLRSARTEGTQSINGTVTYDGTGAGTVGNYGTFLGYNAGQVNTASDNSFFGAYSGALNTTGYYNVFIGRSAGKNNTTGNQQVFLGVSAGYSSTTGTWNTFIGSAAGFSNTSGVGNTHIGNVSGYNNSTGQNNTFVGNGSGFNNISGSSNVFLGNRAGKDELGSNKLYISNSETSNPLIYGDFSSSRLVLNGKVGISTSTFPATIGGVDINAYQLFVKGGILSDEVRVRTGWADYVFDENYSLKSLSYLEDYILRNGHLPNVPSAKEVEKQGLSLGEIAKVQQEKIEELTLYLIKQNKQLEEQGRQITELTKTVNVLVIKK